MQCSLGSKELISQDGRVWAREKGASVWIERRQLNFIDGVGLSYDQDFSRAPVDSFILRRLLPSTVIAYASNLPIAI